MTDDPKIIRSPLSQEFTQDGLTVLVEIYKLEGADRWILELVDSDGGSTVWDEQFPSDTAAFAEFTEGLDEMGLARLIEPDDGEMATVH